MSKQLSPTGIDGYHTCISPGIKYSEALRGFGLAVASGDCVCDCRFLKLRSWKDRKFLPGFAVVECWGRRMRTLDGLEGAVFFWQCGVAGFEAAEVGLMVWIDLGFRV